MDDFGSYRSVPGQPQHLNYKITQLLLIGHSDPELTNGTELGQDAVRKDMEHLQEEDLMGMRHLSEDESGSIFADLRATSTWYHNIPKVFGK